MTTSPEVNDPCADERVKRGRKFYFWWFVGLVVCVVVGLIVGFVLRENAGAAAAVIAGALGYIATVVGVGVSNVFVEDSKLHYTETAQRVAALVAVFALGASLPGLIPQ